MNDAKHIDAFNQDLDRLLNGAAHNDNTELIPAVLLAAASFDAELRPKAGLRERWLKQTARPPERPALRRLWASAALLLIVLLILFHQPVLASIGRIFGFAYLPETGFVNLDRVHVLKNAVTQRHEGLELTVLRGLVTERGTELWLEFSDAARPVDDAWLETPDGTRFDLVNWAYSPDEPGTKGVVALFPPLPDGILETTLALPEGWRIPLTWVPGRESSLIPVDIISAPTLGSEENASAAAEETKAAPTTETSEEIITEQDENAAAVLPPCAEVMEIQFCVQAAVRTENEMQVLVRAEPNGPYTPGSSYSLSMFDVPGEIEGLTLIGASGSIYPIDASYIQTQCEPAYLLSTLRFPGAQELEGPLSLSIPALLVSTPLSAEISIDLGDNPQPGQVIDVHQTVDISGMPVHFGQAVLKGDRKNSLRLEMISDPLDEHASQRPYIIEPGRPDGILDKYGAGSGPGQLSIQIELLQQSGLKTGILRIPLVSATIQVRGPFTLGFDAPAGQTENTSEPVVIENGAFVPLPVGEPLTMDAFAYTGRVLQPGDLLVITAEGAQSTLYAASPASGFSPEEVAVLPGDVLAVYPYPDRQGIDYITGEFNENETVYRQLYTLRFGDPAPRLLIGQFERSAFNFSWSYDGRFLAYTVMDEQPGQSYQRFVRIIDLSCRESGDCSVFTADTGGQDLYQIEWSPVDYRMALGGQPKDQPTGASDIFILQLDAESKTTTLANLTQSPGVDDWAPARWTPDGDALLYPCWTGQTGTNEYSLCRNGIQQGIDQVLIPLLPWNMHSVQLAAGRWVLDSKPVLQNGVFSLRAFDLQTRQASTILEWQGNKSWMETFVSPDGTWAAVTIEDLGGLMVVNIENKESQLVLPGDARHILWAGWVK
jgi:hypothetical protein